jgi:hypothetical protein
VRVEAVLRSKERDLAIVNGKIVRAGDHVGGVPHRRDPRRRHPLRARWHRSTLQRLQPASITGAPMNRFIRMLVCVVALWVRHARRSARREEQEPRFDVSVD